MRQVEPTPAAGHLGRFLNEVRFLSSPHAYQCGRDSRLTVRKPLPDHVGRQHVQGSKPLEEVFVIQPADLFHDSQQIDHRRATGTPSLDGEVGGPPHEPCRRLMVSGRKQPKGIGGKTKLPGGIVDPTRAEQYRLASSRHRPTHRRPLFESFRRTRGEGFFH